MMTTTRICIVACAALAFALPCTSFAQTGQSAASVDLNTPGGALYGGNPSAAPAFVPLANYDKSPSFKQAFNEQGGLAAYLTDVFNIVLSVGGILAVLYIAYAGYLYMGSADMWSNVQHAREVLSNAIIGLLLLFAIYLILNQIDPQLLNLGVLAPAAPTTPISDSTNTASPQQTNPLFGNINGVANIQKDTETGKCYIVDINSGALDPTACP
ncbi:MAG TPA: pilin [Candidatus Paceibacterota bacterium]|nr:pilin [Candidatus Paceibacterota bacterium]